MAYLSSYLNALDCQTVADSDSDMYTYTSPPTSVQQLIRRSDIALWNERTKTVYLIELTMCFDENFAGASMMKQAKYSEVREAVKSACLPLVNSTGWFQGNCQ